jgi:ADP-ribosylglycohydrolase
VLVAGGDFAYGVRLAVNHGGDSDSTGAVAGNLLGALLGDAATPAGWRGRLETGAVIETVGRGFIRVEGAGMMVFSFMECLGC